MPEHTQRTRWGYPGAVSDIDEEDSLGAFTTPYLGPASPKPLAREPETRETPMGEKISGPPAPSTPPPASAASQLRALSTGSFAGAELPQSTDDFMRRVSASQTRYTSIAIVPVVAIGYGFLFMGRVPWVTALAGLGLTVHGLVFSALALRSRNEREHLPGAQVGLVTIAAAAAVPEILFFGCFSYLPAFVALLLTLFAMDVPARLALRPLFAVAVPHTLLQIAITVGWLEDPGLATGSPEPLLMALHTGFSVFVYGFGFVIGQTFLRKTLTTVNGLERATRELAGREAVLREARMELAKAAGIGEPGRFSDQILGGFQLGVVLGRGGMGEIYEAEHLETGKAAAVKLIRRRDGLGPEVIERFVREARTVASLSSKHIVAVYEIGEADSPLPFLAMERLRGVDLADMLRETRRLPLADVAEMVTQIAHGLDAARARDVVHRDLKPPNLFRTNDGTWKLLDFGVARLSGRSRTLTGRALVGTPAYMAPEQAFAGRLIDHRTDVYSLAVVSYRAMTGRPPFAGADVVSIVRAVVHSLPLPPSSIASVPTEVDDVLRIAMAKRADDRFDTALQFASALEAAVTRRLKPVWTARAQKLNQKLAWGAHEESDWEPAVPPDDADDSSEEDLPRSSIEVIRD